MNLFSLNSPFARGINKLVMMLYVGILWFLCSLPILTMGAATAALFEVLLQVVKDQEGYIARRFFQAFRGNLKQGLQLGVPLVLAQIVFAFDFFYYSLFWGEGLRGRRDHLQPGMDALEILRLVGVGLRQDRKSVV